MSIEMEAETEDGGKLEPKVLVAAVVMAVVAGGVTTYALQNLGTAAMAAGFLVVAGLTGFYLANKPTPHHATGTGAYVLGVILIFTPTALYLPDILAGDISLFAEDIEAEEGQIGGGVIFEFGALDVGNIAGGNVASIIDLVVWTVVFMVLALVFLVAGKIVKSMAPDQQTKVVVRQE
ncbi:MAG: hypothetical protein ACOCT0_03295 [Halobacteriota archaeon]